MKPFRFRAQAALDVRRRVEDDARKVFARAEDDARKAEARVNDATQSMCVARETLADAQRAGVNGAELSWHQSWITRQRLEVDARSRDAATSADVLSRALTSVQAAHKARRTLERLRDRMATRHRVETVRHEQRDIDQLASLRFAARLIGQKGQQQ
jgi:flagellar export protein FliJ